MNYLVIPTDVNMQWLYSLVILETFQQLKNMFGHVYFLRVIIALLFAFSLKIVLVNIELLVQPIKKCVTIFIYCK